MQNVIPWKIIAIFGGSGAILSILVGIINRVGFGTILFRGLFLGVICAGVGYGIWFITRRYLPELFQEAKEPTEEGDESEQKGEIGRAHV